jgi:hypothetical protein
MGVEYMPLLDAGVHHLIFFTCVSQSMSRCAT